MAANVKMTKRELERLAQINCTAQEFCGYFKCCRETLNRRIDEFYNMTFGEFTEQFAGEGKVSLRRMGWREALSGKNWPATKFMMENELGMGENINNTLKGFDGGAVKAEVISKTAEEAKQEYLDLLKQS